MGKIVRTDLDHNGEVWFNANDLIIAISEAVTPKRPAIKAVVDEMVRLKELAVKDG